MTVRNPFARLKPWAPGLLALACVAGALTVAPPAGGETREPTDALRPASSFRHISDRGRRSVALFEEAGKVILSPRCVNCHPAGDRPLQGDDEHLHNPPVARGGADMGAAAMECGVCHQKQNTPLVGAATKSMPGNPQWRLAPIEMAWEGKSLAEICVQIKDRARNGGRDLEAIHKHMADDELVAWGWDPGDGRRPAPGSQKIFGELIRDWIDTGAACPKVPN